jgi:hypothetical protein
MSAAWLQFPPDIQRFLDVEATRRLVNGLMVVSGLRQPAMVGD